MTEAARPQVAGLEIVHWDATDLREHTDDVMAVYREAFLDVHEADPARAAAERRAHVSRHFTRDGVRAVAAVGPDGVVVGMSYGFVGAAGQWWHDVVVAGLGPQTAQDWLGDCFEVTELHVRPAGQGHGVGRALLRELLAPATQRTAALSALEQPLSRARRLYASEGFVPLLREFRFPGGTTPYAVLGKRLRPA